MAKIQFFDICKLTNLNLKDVINQLKIIYEKKILIDSTKFE